MLCYEHFCSEVYFKFFDFQGNYSYSIDTNNVCYIVFGC